jgi:hypothetical protein
MSIDDWLPKYETLIYYLDDLTPDKYYFEIVLKI